MIDIASTKSKVVTKDSCLTSSTTSTSSTASTSTLASLTTVATAAPSTLSRGNSLVTDSSVTETLTAAEEDDDEEDFVEDTMLVIATTSKTIAERPSSLLVMSSSSPTSSPSMTPTPPVTATTTTSTNTTNSTTTVDAVTSTAAAAADPPPANANVTGTNAATSQQTMTTISATTTTTMLPLLLQRSISREKQHRKPPTSTSSSSSLTTRVKDFFRGDKKHRYGEKHGLGMREVGTTSPRVLRSCLKTTATTTTSSSSPVTTPMDHGGSVTTVNGTNNVTHTSGNTGHGFGGIHRQSSIDRSSRHRKVRWNLRRNQTIYFRKYMKRPRPGECQGNYGAFTENRCGLLESVEAREYLRECHNSLAMIHSCISHEEADYRTGAASERSMGAVLPFLKMESHPYLAVPKPPVSSSSSQTTTKTTTTTRHSSNPTKNNYFDDDDDDDDDPLNEEQIDWFLTPNIMMGLVYYDFRGIEMLMRRRGRTKATIAAILAHAFRSTCGWKGDGNNTTGVSTTTTNSVTPILRGKDERLAIVARKATMADRCWARLIAIADERVTGQLYQES